MVQHPLHVTGQILKVDSMRTVGQYVSSTVIACDNHKRTAVIGVEDVKIGKTSIRLGHLGMCQLQLL